MVMVLCKHTHAYEPWARVRADCSQPQCAFCPRKILHQPFLVILVSCLAKRGDWGLAARPEMLLNHDSEELAGQGQIGKNVDINWLGKTKRGKPYFILSIQFPAGRSG